MLATLHEQEWMSNTFTGQLNYLTAAALALAHVTVNVVVLVPPFMKAAILPSPVTTTSMQDQVGGVKTVVLWNPLPSGKNNCLRDQEGTCAGASKAVCCGKNMCGRRQQDEKIAPRERDSSLEGQEAASLVTACTPMTMSWEQFYFFTSSELMY